MTQKTDQHKAIIMVVEDDDISYLLIREIVTNLGMKTVRATSKSEVLNLLDSEEDYQLIIMDIILNGSENGITIANELAEMQVELPVMIVSAYATAILKRDRTNMRNVKEIMDKPFNISAFEKLLLKTLKT
jgi:CheY-like chemotaxis protein